MIIFNNANALIIILFIFKLFKMKTLVLIIVYLLPLSVLSGQLNVNVKSCKDWEKVQFVSINLEKHKLENVGLITSKAKGWTPISGVGKIQDRAYKKLKILAAMHGAEQIELLNQESFYMRKNILLSGIAYSLRRPIEKDFIKGNYTVKEIYHLKTNSKQFVRHQIFNKEELHILILKKEGDRLYLERKIEDIPIYDFTVVTLTSRQIVLLGKHINKWGKITYYNVLLQKQ